MEKVLKRVFERKLKMLQRLIRIDDVGSDVIFKRRRRKESITPLCILYYLYNIGSNMGSSISIVGSCALNAFLKPNALYALKNQKRTFIFNSRDHDQV